MPSIEITAPLKRNFARVMQDHFGTKPKPMRCAGQARKPALDTLQLS